MPSDQATWYVKASIGAQWGPISTEILLQMVGDGSLVGADLARCGNDGPWQSIAVLLEELRSKATPIRETELDEIDSKRPSESPDSAEHSIAQPVRQGALPGWTTYWTPGSIGDLPTPTNKPITSTQQHSPEVPDKDGQFVELNAWKRERQERLDRLLKIVAEREAATAPSETRSNSNNDNRNAALEDLTGVNVDPTPSVSESPATRHPVARREEKWEETLARWRHSIPDWRYVVPLILLPWLAWHFWPTTHAHIAETYRSMYAELCRLRDLPLNKTGMEEFVSRSQTKLDEFLPKLERQAAAQDPNAQLLLSLGRDSLKPLLANPRQRGTSQEERLKNLLAEWDRTHRIAPASTRGSSDSKE